MFICFCIFEMFVHITLRFKIRVGEYKVLLLILIVIPRSSAAVGTSYSQCNYSSLNHGDIPTTLLRGASLNHCDSYFSLLNPYIVLRAVLIVFLQHY